MKTRTNEKIGVDGTIHDTFCCFSMWEGDTKQRKKKREKRGCFFLVVVGWLVGWCTHGHTDT